MCRTLAVLGGGPAGLAAGYAAVASGSPCVVLEAAAQAGGNCRTIVRGEFRFDTGAHRLHDRDADVTALLRALLGDELCEVTAPSRIAYNGGYVDFPLSPLNALRALGARRSVRALADLARARIGPRRPAVSFEAFALQAYGRTLAETFLLGYSEKLWGRPCGDLAPTIAGARLRGLGVRGVLSEVLLGQRARASHLDGNFLYPRDGIGRLTDRLAAACGPDTVRANTRVTRVIHDGRRVTAVVLNGRERLDVGAVVSTVPLDALVSMLDPAPPAPVLDAAGGLRWRHVLLVALFLRGSTVTPCATVYFPDPALPFTRVFEPRNRSAAMAPDGHTSLVAEIPCDETNPMWALDTERVVERVRMPLEALGWIRPGEILGADLQRLHHAYPVIDIRARDRVLVMERYLGTLENLRLAGRPGCFAYSHLHDQLRQGRDAVTALSQHLGR